ncbi:hypothetical protein K438DRAFT_656766 [Mycena galopus ATCC 62051]|nr:hypothetical protein K438DRAFT_656766 [Mycena galopus ATCC 62051]
MHRWRVGVCAGARTAAGILGGAGPWSLGRGGTRTGRGTRGRGFLGGFSHLGGFSGFVFRARAVVPVIPPSHRLGVAHLKVRGRGGGCPRRRRRSSDGCVTAMCSGGETEKWNGMECGAEFVPCPFDFHFISFSTFFSFVSDLHPSFPFLILPFLFLFLKQLASFSHAACSFLFILNSYRQCQRRALKCEYPAESRRGMRKKKVVPEEGAGAAAGASTSTSTSTAPPTALASSSSSSSTSLSSDPLAPVPLAMSLSPLTPVSPLSAVSSTSSAGSIGGSGDAGRTADPRTRDPRLASAVRDAGGGVGGAGVGTGRM